MRTRNGCRHNDTTWVLDPERQGEPVLRCDDCGLDLWDLGSLEYALADEEVSPEASARIMDEYDPTVACPECSGPNPGDCGVCDGLGNMTASERRSIVGTR